MPGFEIEQWGLWDDIKEENANVTQPQSRVTSVFRIVGASWRDFFPIYGFPVAYDARSTRAYQRSAVRLNAGPGIL